MSVCSCGHPFSDHGYIPGVQFEDNGYMVHEEDGSRVYGLPDVWVCGGGRLVDVSDGVDDPSPWDFVCGCVLRSLPSVIK